MLTGNGQQLFSHWLTWPGPPTSRLAVISLLFFKDAPDPEPAPHLGSNLQHQFEQRESLLSNLINSLLEFCQSTSRESVIISVSLMPY